MTLTADAQRVRAPLPSDPSSPRRREARGRRSRIGRNCFHDGPYDRRVYTSHHASTLCPDSASSAEFSLDSKRVLFLSKTFGDAMEIDLATGVIRNLTAHFPHFGFTRALYLANGQILLSGPTEFNPANVVRREPTVGCSCWIPPALAALTRSA